MSLFGRACTVDGLRCAIVKRVGTGGYCLTFERKYASLEDLEGVDWSTPEVEDRAAGCLLPEGYGYELTSITYEHGTRCFLVWLKVGAQYLGDVTAYQEQLQQLQAAAVEKDSLLAELSEQLEIADEAVIALYEQLAAAQGEAAGEEDGEAPEETGEDETEVTEE